MKLIKKSILVLTSTVLLGTITGCKAKELVIPTVDVTELKINLPNLPTRNTGDIRSEGEYEFIDLYELSDFHGAVFYEKGHSSGDYIGLAKLATYLDNQRANNPGGTLVLSTGDMFQGSADSNLTRGYMVNYAMQYMGFDAMAVGNHEFDWKEEWLKNNAELKYNTSSIPFLGANIRKGDAMPEYLKASTIVERSGYKVGIIGVIGSELESSIAKSSIEGFEFVKYQTIVNDEAARLKSEEGCNAVVLLAHEAAEEIEVVNNVDAVFGGHAHQNAEKQNNGVPALATLNYGQSVAHISLKFNKSDKSIVPGASTGEIVAMNSVASSLADNKDVKAIMDEYAPAIDKIKNIKLGKSDGELAHDSALKNLCTKSMHEAAVKTAIDNPSLEIDSEKIIAAYHNVNGGIRDDIAKGQITYGSVYKPFPFDNEVVLVKVSGKVFAKNCRNLKNYGIYRTFERLDELKSDETYYMVMTDFYALSDFAIDFKLDEAGEKNIAEEDLIRTGTVVRDEVAKKIYSLKKVKSEEWSKSSTPFRTIS